MTRKSRFALLSILSNTLLIIFKVIAGILSGSVSIISEAIHSSMDLVASCIAFFSVTRSGKPADKEHPFGHGKIENISGVLEGLLIFVAAGLIISEAIKKIMHPGEIEQAYLAVAVMLISGIVNVVVSKVLYKVSHQEDSMALEADALHLKTDVYTSVGVGLGLLLIKLTGLEFLDPVVAIAVALLIIKESWELCRSGLNQLLDTRLSEADENDIRQIMEKYSDRFGEFHKLKTRKTGSMKHIDLHITLDPNMTVQAAHELVGCLKKEMSDKFHNARLTVHIDPIRSDVEETQNNEALDDQACKK